MIARPGADKINTSPKILSSVSVNCLVTSKLLLSYYVKLVAEIRSAEHSCV